jgi:ABC-type cobalt transport system substrate-binding protein
LTSKRAKFLTGSMFNPKSIGFESLLFTLGTTPDV